MDLDIKTLTFTLLLTFFIQAIAFFLMVIAIRKYKGTYLWALGEFFIALGIGGIFLRSFGHYESFWILFSNFFDIGGLILFYIGSKLFFGDKHKNSLLIASFFVYMLIISYFTFVDYQLKIRIIAFSLFLVSISFLIAWIFIHKNKRPHLRSATFVAVLFITNSVFFAYRAFYYIFDDQPVSFFSIDIMQSMTFLLSICLGLLWTFGLIILVNQRLNTELLETKTIFEQIFNTIPDSIVICDKETLKLIETNPNFSSLTGYTKEEAFSDIHFLKNISAEPKIFIPLKEELITRTFFNNKEIKLRRKDGSQRIGLFSSTLIRIKNQDCILSIGRDITEMKQNEIELAVKTQKLEEMIAEKDKFFSILAHDLRGPINTTVNLTDLMTDKSYNLSREELLKLSLSLNKSAKSTNELLENLLEWTGIHRGLKAFTLKESTFADLISTFLPNLMDMARNKHITLKNEIPGDTPMLVDIHMTQTIFRNLIINAIKFTREGGDVVLSVNRKTDGQLLFSVADTGIGMSKETLETLFHLDFKNNRAGTNGESSSGLGLLLCKEFVDKHMGAIWAESEVGKGSTFSFTLGF